VRFLLFGRRLLR